MKKYYFPATLAICFQLINLAPLFGQTYVLDTVLTSGSNTWKPKKPGIKSFYVQVWGGGAGGNGNYGGGGSQYSRSIVYNVTASSYTGGYPYNVAAGVGANTHGNPSNFEGIWAAGGRANGGTGGEYFGGNIEIYFSGGRGGMTYDGGIYKNYAGGGGSAYTNQNGQKGGDGVWNLQGGGGAGTGYGGNANSGAGAAPGGGGAGSGGTGARGEIRIYTLCDYNAGTIGNSHTVPYPAEKAAGTDKITSTSLPSTWGYSFSWERSVNNSSWTTIAGATGAEYILPDTLSVNTWFRRKINGCDDTKNYSNTILIKVFKKLAGQRDGVISGKVMSLGGAGVPGIIIFAQKTINLPGSPQSYKYVDTTDAGGNYSLEGLFYGDNTNGDPDDVGFIVYAVKTGHLFQDPDTISTSLSGISKTRSGINFTDLTTYTVSGKVSQPCSTCIGGITVGLGKVKLTRSGVVPFSTYTDSASIVIDDLGRYSFGLENPGSYTITASYPNHSFIQASQTINVTADVSGIDFTDNTTRTISGVLSDAYGGYIGQATLQFEAVHTDKNGTQTSTFKKTVTTTVGTGAYSITLPSRSHYIVKVNSFTPVGNSGDAAYVRADSLMNFFNLRAKEPFIDISQKDSVRNLYYHRPPVIVAQGLQDSTCHFNPDSNAQRGVIFYAGRPRYFKVDIYEGPVSLGHKVKPSNHLTVSDNNADFLRDFLRVYTDVHKTNETANADTLFYRLKDTTTNVTMLLAGLVAGAPNTTPPYNKRFELHYIDQFGRKATPFKPNATVTGTFNPTKTFTTEAPEIPFLILHSPPGDGSYSFWEKDSSVVKATRFSVAKEDGKDGFLNVSVGPKLSFEVGPVSIEGEVVATLNYDHEHQVTTTTENELVQTTTNLLRYETQKSPIAVENSQDVYIGGGLNYLLGKSIKVDFDEDAPNGGCRVIKNETLALSPEGFRTEFAYTEGHILDVIIPAQQALADQAITDSAKRRALNQISVWQQVIENNKRQKQQAEFLINRSFSNGVVIEEQKTISSTNTNTVSYELLVGNNIGFELGLYSAGVGASGGMYVTMRQTDGNSKDSTTSTGTTTGYHLEDGDPGDYYSVDIRKDPVYGTPVFDLVAGTSSCPPELGAQKRDVPQILSGDMELNNLKVGQDNFFTMNLTNKSESSEARYFALTVDPGTSDGLIIERDGVSLKGAGNPATFLLAYSENHPVELMVRKTNSANKTMSYPNVEFYFSDACTEGDLFAPNQISTAKVTFNFENPCGTINLVSPADGWSANTLQGNLVPIVMAGYTYDNIDSITLEYQKFGTSNWQKGFVVKKANMTNTASFTKNWDIAALPDSIYDIRLRLDCLGGYLLYSQVYTGVIDRKPPALVGKPQPASGLYQPLSGEISFTFNEPISSTNLDSRVELRRRSNNSIVPVSVVTVDGKLIITPTVDLGDVVDSFRVIVQNITDMYGNVKITRDTSYFKLDLAPLIAYTGNNVATVHVVNDVQAENSANRIAMHFRLRQKATKVTRIYFNLSGAALLNTDYGIQYDTILQKKCSTALCNSFVYLPAYNQFINSPAYVNIDSNKTEAIIYFDPLEDAEQEGTENIRIDLLAGSEYKLQDSVSAEGYIINFGQGCPLGNILYVNKAATGNNTGGSWQNAFTSLQDALAKVCDNVTQIWVAKGTYYPDEGVGKVNNDRTASFNLKPNVPIYGGLQGNEPPNYNLSLRDFASAPTVLSGDIDNNTQPDVVTGSGSTLSITGNAGNSYHVIRNVYPGYSALGRLDGFTIKGGNANGAGEDANGAGIHTSAFAVRLDNCIITGNQASGLGGALYNYRSFIGFRGSNFSGNKANFGGAIYSLPLGGFLGSHSLENCSFNGNVGTTTGGALVVTAPAVTGSSMECTNSTFTNNYSFNGSNYGSGGAGYFENVNFPATFTNCLFNGNKGLGSDTDEGGGALMVSDGTVNIINSTFVNNQAVKGGALRIYLASGKFVVKNSIFWSNTATTSADIFPGGTLEINNSLLQSASCPAGATCGAGNLFNINPSFISAANNNYRLAPCSPAIDAGNDADNSTFVDLANNARKVNLLANPALIDMGAYEVSGGGSSGGILYVNAAAAPGGDGNSWATAVQSLQEVLTIRYCPSVQQIWVAKGTYKPTSNTNRDSSFVMKNNLGIYGGFTGYETSLLERNWQANPTILSGDIGDIGNINDNSYHVVLNNGNSLNSTAILDGFTITGGNAFKGDYFGNRGGGVHNFNSAPAYYNCIFTGNNAVEYGGAIFTQNSAAKFTNCVMAGNTAAFGGGMYNESAATEVVNCTFAGNQVVNTGAAIYTYGAVSPKVTNSIVWGNGSGIQNAGGATPIVAFSIVQGATPYLPQDSIFFNKPAPGLGNIGDLRLRTCSPAVNVGNNAAAAALSLDLAGNSRVFQSTVDIGAYERTAVLDSNVYVDINATGKKDGTSWLNAYTSITDAIADLNQCANPIAFKIYVAKGTYIMPVNTPAIMNRLNATVLGGYPTGGGIPNPAINQVIIKGSSGIRVLKTMKQLDGVRITN